MKLLLVALAALTFSTLGSCGKISWKPRENFRNCTAAGFHDPKECDTATCDANPECACAGTQPDVPLSQRPQIVYLTFDDGFTALAETNYYKTLFDGTYKNPNNCSIRATHFLAHLSTDYTLVAQYYKMGHEMAAHSITHRANQTYWRVMSESQWKDEMVGMRQIINKFAKIPEDDVIGIRVPYLQSGGDEQISMMIHNNFAYDCSRPTRYFGYTNMANGFWPFTLDYLADIDCQIEPCPSCAFPGVWVQPMLDLEDNWFDADPDPEGEPCAMLDSCIIPESSDPKDVFEMLKRNFDRAYNGYTRAPFGLYMHAAWFFGGDFRYQGYKMFLDYITQFDDVWIVPIRDGIEYRKNPMTNDQLINGEFEPFNCDSFPSVDCTTGIDCQYVVDNEDIHGQEVFMRICDFKCPKNYPWLGNPLGN